RTMQRDGGLTASPNAGRTMAAMAGALGVTLEKRGHYRLGDGPPPDVAATDRAVRVFAGPAGACLCVSLLLLQRLPSDDPVGPRHHAPGHALAQGQDHSRGRPVAACRPV